MEGIEMPKIKNTRRYGISLRLNASEIEWLRSRANIAQTSVAEYLRILIASARAREIPSVYDSGDKEKFIAP
jgi:hypothetical protein